MAVRLLISLDDDLYRRLKEMPREVMRAFINRAVRARIQPDRRTLDAAYEAASKERWRRTLAKDWSAAESEGQSE